MGVAVSRRVTCTVRRHKMISGKGVHKDATRGVRFTLLLVIWEIYVVFANSAFEVNVYVIVKILE